MSNSASSPIKDKATDWWQLISGEDTAKVYQDFFKRTWTILKETALLLWLLLCGVLVSVEWIWNSSSRVTESVSDLAKSNNNPESNTMSEAGTKLWTGIQKGASGSIAKAREQLQMPASPPKAPKSKPAPEPSAPAPASSDKAPAPETKTVSQYKSSPESDSGDDQKQDSQDDEAASYATQEA
ncbi:MAG: hypothetical protein AAF329_23510 [Cyanobacteria bacterium P01_A01_bin.17]